MLNVRSRDDLVLLELDHGAVNALDLELLAMLVSELRLVPIEKPIVLTGAGRAFSAGVDLRRISAGGTRYTTDFLATLSECFLAVYDHPAPTVAAINGAAMAGGCIIAAACDRRVISRGPIGLAELAVGVPFPTSALEIMRDLIGPRVSQLILDAPTLTAEGALAVGLVNEIVPSAVLLERATELALSWQALPPGVFAATKRQLHAPVRARIAQRAEADDAIATELWASQPVRTAIDEYLSSLSRRQRPGETGSSAGLMAEY